MGETQPGAAGTMTETHKPVQRPRRVEEEEIDNPAAPTAGSPSEEMPDAPPMKKRRRGAKANSDKKFECKHEGCGKSYSRAEHLYRHQLNHTPKNIYRCDYPECNRYFVRQDLCLRHRERHTTNGSQLHKRDVFAQTTTNQSPIAAAPTRGSPGSLQQISSPTESQKHVSPSDTRHCPENFRHSISKSEESSGITGSRPSGSAASASSASVESRFEPPTPQAVYPGSNPATHRSNSSSSHTLSPHHRQSVGSSTSLGHQGSYASTDTLKHEASFFRSPQDVSYDGRPMPALSPTRTYSSSQNNRQEQYFSDSPIMTNTQASSHTHPFNESVRVPPYTMESYPSESPQHTSNASLAAAVSESLNALNSTTAGAYVTMPDGSLGMDMAAAYAYPVFGGDEYNRSPNAMGDDFTAWLFNENQSAALGYPSAAPVVPGFDNNVMPFAGTYYPIDSAAISIYSNVVPPQHAMSVMSIVDSSGPIQYAMSEEKRQELLDLMSMQFYERPHDAVKRRKDAVFEGDINDENHILSLRMMNTYMGSYWYHQHAQLPILHKPTFTADKTPNLLLLMVIAIGAATLDKAYGTSLTDSAAEFANFVVWHVRWEIMRDADSRPPAKLWVFQTLLLVEIYEKMYSTRDLHERGHIHHDSTLTLMRRGSSLIGRAAFDSPPSLRDDKTTRSSATNSAPDTPGAEETWAHWIISEATRRAAFAAFVIDSIHATMFGHSAKMVAHEMRLPLPCDEGLWSATTAAEAARFQSTLQTNGIKPTMFLDGLKKTLNGQRVRTNSFGRTILMAGLLSVSWHMTQRDLSITTLGAQTFGGRNIWRKTLLMAFDNWKRDFDSALHEATATSPDYPTPLARSLVPRPIDDENIFESRTVLHHLAHMASHVDIVDCQIFAGASRLLGRPITPKDYSNVREKITERWATRASARDAAFYALKFLVQVLTPPYEGDRFGHASYILPLAFEQNLYYARDDFLLNRPWVLYFSALVVWCYGYALEGPINPKPTEEQFATVEQRDKDMRDYLHRVGGIRAPDDLEGVKGKNRCLGLLLILKESFSLTRWELTHEAASLLGNCINKLKGMDGAGPRVT